jgi:hypothetical protein
MRGDAQTTRRAADRLQTFFNTRHAPRNFTESTVEFKKIVQRLIF